MDQHGMSICPNLEPLSCIQLPHQCQVTAAAASPTQAGFKQTKSPWLGKLPGHEKGKPQLQRLRFVVACGASDDIDIFTLETMMNHTMGRVHPNMCISRKSSLKWRPCQFETGASPSSPQKNVPLSLGAWPCDGAPPPPGSGAGRPGHENGAGNSAWANRCVGEVRVSYSYLPPSHIVLG